MWPYCHTMASQILCLALLLVDSPTIGDIHTTDDFQGGARNDVTTHSLVYVSTTGPDHKSGGTGLLGYMIDISNMVAEIHKASLQ